MTDNKTDSANKNFDLNHFDPADETESFYADDLFTEAIQTEQLVAEEKTDPFAEFGYEKKEPIIPQEAKPLADVDMTEPKPDPNQQEAADIETELPDMTPPISNTPASAPPDEQRPGTKSITIFAILAMLVAAMAVWLNPGDRTDSDEASPLKPRPVLAADIQIQRLETRLSSLEQNSKQQREELNQQIKGLQQQLSSLTSQLAKQARKQQPTRHAAAPTTKRSTSAHHPSTAPVSSTPNTGWVVNLVSVDSKRAAAKALSQYKAQGIPAEIYSAMVKGKSWHRLRISGFASKQEAIAQKKYLAAKHGIKDAWIQKP